MVLDFVLDFSYDLPEAVPSPSTTTDMSCSAAAGSTHLTIDDMHYAVAILKYTPVYL